MYMLVVESRLGARAVCVMYSVMHNGPLRFAKNVGTNVREALFFRSYLSAELNNRSELMTDDLTRIV